MHAAIDDLVASSLSKECREAHRLEENCSHYVEKRGIPNLGKLRREKFL
jgi:hypothetical protein